MKDFIYGRGACDAKGIIAAQLTAAEQLRAGGVEQIGLLFTVDEEVGSLGARTAGAHNVASLCRYLINSTISQKAALAAWTEEAREARANQANLSRAPRSTVAALVS